MKRCAAASLSIEGHSSVQMLDYFLYDSEPEACAGQTAAVGAVRLGKRLKNASTEFVRDTWSAVCHRNSQPIILPIERHKHRLALRRELGCVRHQIGEDLDEAPTSSAVFFDDIPPQLAELYNLLEAALGGFGPDVERLVYSTRVTFKAYKIFAQVNKRKKDGPRLLLFVDLGIDEIDDPLGICQDMTGVGHHGVLNMQVTISSREQLDFAVELARLSYDRNSVEAQSSDQD